MLPDVNSFYGLGSRQLLFHLHVAPPHITSMAYHVIISRIVVQQWNRAHTKESVLNNFFLTQVTGPPSVESLAKS